MPYSGSDYMCTSLSDDIQTFRNIIPPGRDETFTAGICNNKATQIVLLRVKANSCTINDIFIFKRFVNPLHLHKINRIRIWFFTYLGNPEFLTLLYLLFQKNSGLIILHSWILILPRSIIKVIFTSRRVFPPILPSMIRIQCKGIDRCSLYTDFHISPDTSTLWCIR